MASTLLQLISSAGYYGAERVLIELACYLRDEGHDSRVGVFRHDANPIPVADEARRQGLTVVEFPCHGQYDRTLPKRIAEYAARENVRLAHSHGYKSDIYLGWAPLAQTTRRFATCHNWLTGGLRLWVYQKLDLRALRRFDRVVAVSDPVLATVRAGGVARERSLLIGNGLNVPVVRSATVPKVRAEFTAGPDEFLMVQIGRLSAEKGNDLLLEAFASASLGNTPGREARLVFAGDGPERAALERQAERLGLLMPHAGRPRVVFAGYRSDVPLLLAACDLFVISSHYEGLPTVLLEAMALGRQIIATRVGMIPQVLEEGAAGGLVPPGDAVALTAALRSVLNSPTALEPMARRAREIYQARHSREAMGHQYATHYASCGGI